MKGAVGFDQKRGDNVAVTSQTFVAQDGATGRQMVRGELDAGPVGRNVTALVVAALLVFGIGRPLLKRRAAAVEQKIEQQVDASAPSVGQEIATALADAAGRSRSAAGR